MHLLKRCSINQAESVGKSTDDIYLDISIDYKYLQV